MNRRWNYYRVNRSEKAGTRLGGFPDATLRGKCLACAMLYSYRGTILLEIMVRKTNLCKFYARKFVIIILHALFTIFVFGRRQIICLRSNLQATVFSGCSKNTCEVIIANIVTELTKRMISLPIISSDYFFLWIWLHETLDIFRSMYADRDC